MCRYGFPLKIIFECKHSNSLKAFKADLLPNWRQRWAPKELPPRSNESKLHSVFPKLFISSLTELVMYRGNCNHQQRVNFLLVPVWGLFQKIQINKPTRDWDYSISLCYTLILKLWRLSKYSFMWLGSLGNKSSDNIHVKNANFRKERKHSLTILKPCNLKTIIMTM